MGLDVEFRTVGFQTIQPDILPVVKVDPEVFVVTPILQLYGCWDIVYDVRNFYDDLGYKIDLSQQQVVVTKDLYEYLKQRHSDVACDNIDNFFKEEKDSRFVLIFWA